MKVAAVALVAVALAGCQDEAPTEAPPAESSVSETLPGEPVAEESASELASETPSPDELQPGVEVGCAQSWREAADRAMAATLLEYSSRDGVRYKSGAGVAFYIGNDEWISLGRPSPDYPRAFGRGTLDTSESIGLEEGLRPTTLIGFDRKTVITLERASGEGIPPLRLADALPRQCMRLRLAGYWAGYSGGSPFPADALGFPKVADCHLGLAPRLAWAPLPPGEIEDNGVVTGFDSLQAGTAGTMLATVFTDQGLSFLLLHRSDEMDSIAYGGYFSGGPVINQGGEVVGVYHDWAGGYRALGVPAIREALARIRAAASEVDG